MVKRELNEVKFTTIKGVNPPYKRDFQAILGRLQANFFAGVKLYVDVLFTDQEGIARVAEEYGKERGQGGIDVLSFPLYEREELTRLGEMFGELNLGQVIFSYEEVRRGARRLGHSYRREFCYLFVHSLLHLLSYDHLSREEEVLMHAEAERIMQELGIRKVRRGVERG